MSFQTQNNGIGGSFAGGFAPNLPGLNSTIAGTELATPWASTQSPFGGFAGGDGFSPSLYGTAAGTTQGAQQQWPSTYLGINGPPSANANAQQGSLGQLVSLFANMLQALMGALGGSSSSGAGSTGGAASPTAGPQITSPQTFVQSATISSTGDPHLSASGTTANGTAISTKYDSMTGHRDLVDSDSFAGGYRVSTQTTTPDANGITYNKSATVRTGDASVTVDNSGNVTVKTASPFAGRYASPDGPTSQSTTLASGQSMTLDSGAVVTKNADGSVTMSDTNATGGSITTTFTQNGTGVDVVTSANNADLGGDVMNKATGQPAQSNVPPWRQTLGGGPDPNAPVYLA